MKNYLMILIFILSFACCNLTAENIIIDKNSNINEPAIKIDPNNPARIVAGANIDNSYISNDTGKTWKKIKLTAPLGVWGDPCIDVDSDGNFYFFHLSNPPITVGKWIDRIMCQRLDANEEIFNYKSYLYVDGNKAQDKEWSVINPKNNNIYVTWTQFDSYGSTLPTDSSSIMFAKSNDKGLTWSKATRLNSVAGDCIDSDNTTEGAVPAIGVNGEIYVTWMGPLGLVFNKSIDDGQTWMPQEKVLQDLPGGWDFNIPGIMRSNGFPIIKCDLSNSDNRGNIYINWSDQRNGIYDTDIWLIKSKDGGNTWSERIRVNNDSAGKHQFFTWMDIDQTNGYIYIIFYDRRAYNDYATDVYMAVSTDGGNTFNNFKISDTPFVPNSNIFFGDYINISVHNGIIRPIWIRMDRNINSIMTETDPLSKSSVKEEFINEFNENINAKTYPNPADNYVYTSFKLKEKSKVSIGLYDIHGKIIFSLKDNVIYESGAYSELIDISKLNLQSGIYYTKITINNNIKTLKTVIID